MDFNAILAGFEEFGILFFSDRLLSLGYPQPLANMTSEVNASLMRGARDLNQARLLDHDGILSARWS